MSEIVVTGGTGFLGQAVLRHLTARGDEVVALKRPGSSAPAIDGVRWVEQNLAGGLDDSLPSRAVAVIHLAQSRRYREFPEGAVDVFEVNASATVRLLDYGRRVGAEAFIYASSGAVYEPGPKPVAESDIAKPGNFYAMSKLAGEQALGQFRSHLNAHALRFFFIYGPGQRNMFIPGLVDRVRNGQDVILAGPTGISVNPVYVEDAAAAVIASLKLDQSRTLNVAGLEVVSVREIAELTGQLLGAAPSFAVGEPTADLVASTVEQTAALGKPQTGFEEGLGLTVASG